MSTSAAEVSIPDTRIQEALDALDAQNSLLDTCTLLYKNLSSQFSSLENSLQQKSETLESNFQTLESKSAQLETLAAREQSIPCRESAAAARVEKQKQSALAEFEKPPATTAPEGNDELVEALRSYCRKMDSSGLRKFVVSKRLDVSVLREVLGPALIEEAVDPARLVLDAFEEFVSQKVVVAEQRWACGVLLRALLFLEVDSSGKLGLVGGGVSRSIEEKAAAVLEAWRRKMDGKEGGAGGMGAAEAQMFLYMVVGFGLRSRYEEEFLRKLVLKFPSRRDMAKLTVALGFQEKMGDIIDELVKNGKQLEAVYFAQESGLSERFPPLPLLRSFFNNMKKITSTILKKGRYCTISWESADNVELNSLRSLIKCVEDNKLESDFPIEDLKKRFAQLEKEKADRKMNPTTGKSKNKRALGSSDTAAAAAFPPSKAGRFSVYREAPGRPNPGAAYPGSYNYHNQRVYEAPAAAPYGSSYGGSHGQSPAAAATYGLSYGGSHGQSPAAAATYGSSYGGSHGQSPAAAAKYGSSYGGSHGQSPAAAATYGSSYGGSHGQSPAAAVTYGSSYGGSHGQNPAAAVTYGSSYGGSHGQNPAALPQHYSHMPSDVGGARASGSYSGPASYVGHNFDTTGLPPPQQPSYPH
ncbi:FRIGIDA-like protein 4a [Magnolia sinica]|uniref:FRIGIDA-like protein 4a n=1 Tax=Magnolia sinica TaxID=86752 RepID=UPI002658F4B9|nr:FRIGIDA-like protein 4a [Magnolia sinica]